jgi:hypothetical protein
MNRKTADSYAIFSMILGIASFFGWLPFGLCAIIMSSMAKKGGTTKQGMANSGLILSIISIALGLIFGIVIVVVFMCLMADLGHYYNWA